MSGRKRKVSLIEVVVVALIVVVVCSVLSPVIATGTGGSALAQCQANLRKIGGAFRMYLADWDRTYMTNRLSNAVVGSYPLKEVAVATAGQVDPVTGKPIKFATISGIRHISWVGALYDYIGPVTSKGSPNNVWKCPAASSAQAGTYPATAYVTYLINANLLQQPESVIRYASTLMLCRENDRLVASACRAFKSGTTGAQPVAGQGDVPASPFMTTVDSVGGYNQVQNKPHGNGSNILFADGHVKTFAASSFPATNVAIWNTTLGTWGNGPVGKAPTVTLMP